MAIVCAIDPKGTMWKGRHPMPAFDLLEHIPTIGMFVAGLAVWQMIVVGMVVG
jgi:hypothetical protein